MGVFDEDIESARELIAESGEDCSIKTVRPGVADPTRSWEAVPSVETNVQVKAVFLNYKLAQSGEAYTNGSLIKTGDKKVLIAAASIFEILQSDHVVRANGDVYKIQNVKTLDPNGQHILHELQVRR